MIRTELSEDGEPLICAADLVRIVGIKCPQRAYARIDENYKVVRDTHTLGGRQEMIYLTEPGVYQFLLSLRPKEDSPHKQRIAEFQKLVFEEVIPSIRRTGSFGHRREAIAPSQATLAPHVAELDATIQVAKLCGLEGNQALICASNRMNRDFGVDVLNTLQLKLPSPGNQAWLTPTEIGSRWEQRSAQKANARLAELGLQYREGGQWRMTEAGKAHGEYQDCGKKDGRGTPIQVVRWRESVLDLVCATPACVG